MSIPLDEYRNLVAGSSESAAKAFAGLAPGQSIHGLTDGSWSLSDAIGAILDRIGKIDRLTVSTWTTNSGDIRTANTLLDKNRIKSIRFLVDRSFKTRKPKYCESLIETFGVDAIRIWNGHAKFVIFEGGDLFDALYLTSANLNKNIRIENFSLFAGSSMPDEYLNLVDKVFEIQKPNEVFDTPRLARAHTQTVFADLQGKHVPSSPPVENPRLRAAKKRMNTKKASGNE